jgi:hypothetical protein
MRQRKAGAPSWRKLILPTERSRPGREFARPAGRSQLLVGIRGQLAEFDTSAAFDADRSTDVGLQRE